MTVSELVAALQKYDGDRTVEVVGILEYGPGDVERLEEPDEYEEFRAIKPVRLRFRPGMWYDTN